MEKYVGRKRELAYLKNLYESSKSEFLVLYGRRRVGKTELLRQFCADKSCVFYTCVETTSEEELKLFSESLFKAGAPASKYTDSFRSWQEAFHSLPSLPIEGKKIVVIDEFPYMARADKSLPSVLQEAWDVLLKNENIFLIICGSSLSFIEKEVLAEKKPLYGRATAVYKLLPLSYNESKDFFPDYSTDDKIRAYSILGGIPYYLLQFDADKPLEENIKRKILFKGALLYSETEFLMRQEFRETAIYNTIIKAVAFGNTKLNDIYTATQIDKAKLSAYLANLVETGIIQRELSASEGIRQTALRERGLYKLSDNFFRFYYAFCFPYLSALEQGGSDAVGEKIVFPKLDEFVSYSFEDICRQYAVLKNNNMELNAFYIGIGRWWNKTDEIDIFAATPNGKNILLGECKFRKSVFDSHDFNSLKAKYPVNDGTDVEYLLFSRNGFEQKLVDEATENHSIKLVSDELL